MTLAELVRRFMRPGNSAPLELRCQRTDELCRDVPWNRSLTPCPCEPCTRYLALYGTPPKATP